MTTAPVNPPQQVTEIPDGIAAELLAIYALMLAGNFTKEQTAGLLSQALIAGKFTAAISASTTAFMWAVNNGKPGALPHVPQHLESGSERLTTAFTTIIEDSMPAEQDEFRIERLGRNEVLETLFDVALEALAEYGIVEWEWVTDSEPCESCEERDGQRYPIDEPFRDHPGCQCSFTPVIPEDWEEEEDYDDE